MISPDPVDFDAVATSQTKDLTVTLSNGGGTTISGTLAALSAPLEIVGSSAYSLGPGESATVTVRYSPTAGGFTIQELVALDDGGSQAGAADVGGYSDQWRPMAYNKTSGRYTYSDDIRLDTTIKGARKVAIFHGDVWVTGHVRARNLVKRFYRNKAANQAVADAFDWDLSIPEAEPSGTSTPQPTNEPSPVVYGRVAYNSGGDYEHGVNGVVVTAVGVGTSTTQTIGDVDGLFALSIPWDWTGWVYASSDSDSQVVTAPYYLRRVTRDLDIGFEAVSLNDGLEYDPSLGGGGSSTTPTMVYLDYEDEDNYAAWAPGRGCWTFVLGGSEVGRLWSDGRLYLAGQLVESAIAGGTTQTLAVEYVGGVFSFGPAASPERVAALDSSGDLTLGGVVETDAGAAAILTFGGAGDGASLDGSGVYTVTEVSENAL